ncbi:13487_t:CDS:2 [Cetraspora pellucida]|uniref:13487_t:CDS:1 n=1 Tax=Cetraspora pellucida TaxID=1433469 RepID=A0ACA9LKP9_9GLOM|nr:13487_t:CDS:2 [Cetraspora pellucida]
MVWAMVFFLHASTFFIVCIALNLHLIFINEYSSSYNFEKYYFVISFSLALIISLLPITANMYGFDDPEGDCWYRDSGEKHNIIWEWVTLYGWTGVSILYCAIVVIIVIIKLRSVTKNVNTLDNSSTSQLSGHLTLINKTVVSSIVKRVMWYPVVPLVAQFFGSFVETYAYINHVISFPLYLLCFIGISTQGFLNALVFSQDIAVTRAFQVVKLQWWITNVNFYESHYPHRSRNKSIKDEFGTQGKFNDFVELQTLNRNDSDITKSVIINNVIDDDIINNDPNASPLIGKDDSKNDITLKNQNNDQDIHLDHPEPVHLNCPSQHSSLCSRNNQIHQTNINNTNVIDISNCAVSEEQIDVILVNYEQTKRVSGFIKRFSSDIDLPQEIETFEILLKKL